MERWLSNPVEKGVPVSSSPGGPDPAPAPGRLGTDRADCEVTEIATRRRFTAEYKVGILKEAEGLRGRELVALLRREGLYRSHLDAWRVQEARGSLESRKRGRKPDPRTELRAKVSILQKQNEQLKRKLERAETIIELQKKLSDLLKLASETSRSGEAI